MKKISSSFKISLLALSASIFTLSPLQAEEKKKALSHESEAAVVIQGGNSETQTYSVKQKTVYTMKPSEFTLTGGYLLGRAKVLPNGDLEKNAENWNAALRYDYYVNDRFSIWAQHGWEGDKFAGYHTRTNNDIGGKYYLWKKDKNAYFFTELGYRYTLENPLVGDDVDLSLIHI